MTFDDFFSEFRLTAAERKELVWRLAFLRFQKTIEVLLPERKTNVGDK